ncbi:tRNA lysidine(34) synthetase TilS [Aestuariivirga sp.]|uniref:tRNA lysidine(34) synthetase TilS n=1 Tax=Aestuariivirga sp. TaxID=2650926 RepID=UPI0039E32472
MPAAPADLFQAIKGEPHAALAVSGGSDSMAMLRLAQAWSGTAFTVLTVDHGLRATSADEALKVAACCRAIGLSHVTLRWHGLHPITGIQAKARQARYDLMGQWCRDNGATVLLTAHTMDDQAETVLMRMARTSSIDSLAGILRESQWKGLRVFRPLLGERRQALRDYLTALGQPWIDDPSNDDERFERVRIRKAMAGVNAAGIPPERLADLAAEFQALVSWQDEQAAAFIGNSVWSRAEGYAQIRSYGRSELSRPVWLRVLRKVVQHVGVGSDPERAEIERMADAIATRGVRRTLGGTIFWNRGREILVCREPARVPALPVTVPDSGSVRWDDRFLIGAPPGSVVQGARHVPGIMHDRGGPKIVLESQPVVRLPDAGWVWPGYDPAITPFLDFRPRYDL